LGATLRGFDCLRGHSRTANTLLLITNLCRPEACHYKGRSFSVGLELIGHRGNPGSGAGVVAGLARSVSFLWRPTLPDADDDMVLETAVNGQGDGTFNRRDFGPAEQFGIAVLLPGEAVKRLENGS
jgi:hypothetical protein